MPLLVIILIIFALSFLSVLLLLIFADHDDNKTHLLPAIVIMTALVAMTVGHIRYMQGKESGQQLLIEKGQILIYQDPNGNWHRLDSYHTKYFQLEEPLKIGTEVYNTPSD